LPEIGRSRMRGDQNIAAEAVEHRKGALEVLNCVRVGVVAAEVEPVGRDGSLTVAVDQVHAPVLFASAPGPGGAPRRVPRSEVRSYCNGTDAQHLAVLDRAHLRYRIDREERAVLGIIRTGVAGLQHGRAPGAGGYLGAGRLLQGGDAARVIIVDVRVQDQTYVAQIESQGVNVFRNRSGGFGEPAVDEYVSFVGSNEDSPQSLRSHPVAVAEDPDRLVWPIPFDAGVASGCRRGLRYIDLATPRQGKARDRGDKDGTKV